MFEEDLSSKRKCLCRTCFRWDYGRLLNNLAEQSYFNRTIEEIITFFLPDKVITFNKSDLICPECLMVLSAFAKFITKFLEVQEIIDSRRSKRLDKPSVDENKIGEPKYAIHEMSSEREEEVKSDEESTETFQLNVINTIHTYSAKSKKYENKIKVSVLDTVSLELRKGERDMNQVEEQDQEREQENENVLVQVDDTTLTSQINTTEISVQEKCKSCDSCITSDCITGTENSGICSKCSTEEQTPILDNFCDSSDSGSIFSNSNELDHSRTSTKEEISDLKGVIPFVSHTQDLHQICGKGNHNHIIRVPGVKEIDPEFIKVLIKNDIKVLNQSSEFETKNKRILFVGESLLRTTCSICGQRLASYDLWVDHMKTSHENKPRHLPPDVINCKWSTVVHPLTSSQKYRKLHVKCRACPKRFISVKLMEKHASRIHKDREKFRCEDCRKSFKCKRYFKLHRWKFEQNQTCDVRKCKWCQQWVKRSNFSEHAKEHKNFICEVCGKCFILQHRLKIHVKAHSKGKKPNKTKLCPICGKVVYNIGSHVRTVHEDKNKGMILCHLCPKMLSSRPVLKKHIANVHCVQKKRTQCSVCEMWFSMPSALKNHIRLKHSGVPKHTCLICGEGFVRGDYYKRHMDSHVKGRSRMPKGPVKCKFCSKMLKSVACLKSHLASHLNYRERYKCKYCDMSLGNETNKRRHEKLHKNFKIRCNICWQKFTNKEDLDKHIVIHEKKKKYKCHICMQSFCRKYLCSHHVMTVHKDNVEDEKSKEKEIVFKEVLDFL